MSSRKEKTSSQKKSIPQSRTSSSARGGGSFHALAGGNQLGRSLLVNPSKEFSSGCAAKILSDTEKCLYLFEQGEGSSGNIASIPPPGKRIFARFRHYRLRGDLTVYRERLKRKTWGAFDWSPREGKVHLSPGGHGESGKKDGVSLIREKVPISYVWVSLGAPLGGKTSTPSFPPG